MRVDVPGRSPEGALLREFRIRADLTQRMLGDLAGYANSMVASVEVGIWRPNEQFIRNVASVLRLSLAEEQQLIKLRTVDWSRPRSKKRTMKTLANDTVTETPSTSDLISDAA